MAEQRGQLITVARILKRNKTIKLQFAVGQGSGLIHTQHIHPCQCLNAEEFLHKRIALTQPYHAHGEGNARQQHKPLRQKPEKCRRRGSDGGREGYASCDIAFIKQHSPQRNDEQACKANYFIEGCEYHRIVLFGLLGLACNARSITILAHLVRCSLAQPSRNKAAGEQRIAYVLFYGNSFSGKQCFVHGDTATLYRCVRTDLIAPFEAKAIALGELLRPNMLHSVVSHDADRRCC